MSEKEKTLIKICLTLLALVVVFLLLRRNGATGDGTSYDIGGSSINGATNNITNENEPANENAYKNYFNSQNDVSVNTFGLNEMSKQYIPMFGLVGMTSVGNIVVQQNAQPEERVGRVQAAPQQVYQAATAPYQGYLGNAPALQRYGGMGSIGAQMQLKRAAREGRLQQFVNS